MRPALSCADPRTLHAHRWGAPISSKSQVEDASVLTFRPVVSTRSRALSSTTSHPFYKLLVGEGFSALTSSVLAIAIPIIAVAQLGADAWSASLLAASSQAAPLVFGLSAGAIADTVNRRLLLWLGNGMRAVLMLLLFAAAVTGQLSIPLLAVVAFLVSCAQLLCDCAMVAAIPAIVNRRRLTWANGWFEAVASTAQSVGPALAGVAIQSGAIGSLFFLGAVAHLASSYIFKTLPLDRGQPADDEHAPHLHQVKQGLKILWNDKVQRSIALSSATFNFFHSAFFALFPVYALNTLGFSATGLGVLLSVAGAAGLIAAFCAEPLIEKLTVPATLIASLFIILPFSLLITFGGSAPFPYNGIAIVIAFAAWDFAVVMNVIIEQSIRQAMVDPAYLSRVGATQRFVAWGVDPLGALAGGALAITAVGLPDTLNIAMWGMGASGLILLLTPAVRALPKSFGD